MLILDNENLISSKQNHTVRSFPKIYFQFIKKIHLLSRVCLSRIIVIECNSPNSTKNSWRSCSSHSVGKCPMKSRTESISALRVEKLTISLCQISPQYHLFPSNYYLNFIWNRCGSYNVACPCRSCLQAVNLIEGWVPFWQ